MKNKNGREKNAKEKRNEKGAPRVVGMRNGFFIRPNTYYYLSLFDDRRNGTDVPPVLGLPTPCE